MGTRYAALPAALLLVGTTVGCGSAPATIGPTGVDELVIPTPTPDPDDFVDRIDHPLLPLTPGSTWEYVARGEDGVETITVTVTDETRTVHGVTATVVHDVVRDEEGAIVEDTYDWFAQDRRGNVWYLGEDTTAYDDGVPSKEGSWEAGVDGAQAGLAMPAEPRIGDGYAQEYLPGEAEDQAEVLDLDATRRVGGETYEALLHTEDTTPLEPGLVEHKFYASGVGLVLEETVSGGDEVVELVSFRRG